MSVARLVFAVLAVYALAGAVGLAHVTLSQVFRHGRPPEVLHAERGFWHVMRAGLRLSLTWPWTWKEWTRG